MPGSGFVRQFDPRSSAGIFMATAQPQAILTTQARAQAEAGRALQCRGCGEIGHAAWTCGAADALEAAPEGTRLSGNFYLHQGRIACGRCQQIYRID
jgi:hypothetical protein